MENKKIHIVYSDKDITVCIKPDGILSEGDGKDCMPAMLSEICGGEKVYTVHRLDKETRGLIVYGRNSAAAAGLSAQITDGSFKKEYMAVLCGRLEDKEGSIKSLLFYDRRLGKSFCVDRERKGVKEALLDYSVIGENAENTLVRVKLHTGRTHQIRVQFASIGYPLLGDRRYGAPKSDHKGIALVSCFLELSHPRTGEQMTFSYSLEDEYPWNIFK